MNDYEERLFTLGLSPSASAQKAGLETNPEEVKLQRLFNPLHRADSAAGMVRDLASAPETAPRRRVLKRWCCTIS